MTDKAILEKHISENLLEYAQKFDIPQDYIKDFPDIVEMILNSRSIDNDEERQNWFNLLPMMNDSQMSKFRNILEKEKKKLDEIEKKYEDKKVEIKKKYLFKWQKMWYIKKISNLREEENQQSWEDEKEAEELLEKL